MTEAQEKLLVVLETRIHDLMALCDGQKQKITTLSSLLQEKEQELKRALEQVELLNAKYESLLTARIVSADSREVKDAKSNISRLVREVDKCIALLNGQV